MNRLFTALGVDYGQWLALTRAALKMDMRSTRIGTGRRQPSGSRFVLGQLLFFAVVGIFMSMAIGYLNDVFLSGLMLFSYIILSVGTAMLADHNSVLVSPNDYLILGFQPVTSRTYFAAKLTNVLFYTLLISNGVGLLPVIVLASRHGAAVGGAALIALLMCSITVTVGIAVVYASLVRVVGARRLRNIVSYTQMVTSIGFYGGYFLVSSIPRSALASVSVEPSPWLLLYPGTWYANFLQLAAGQREITVVLSVFAAVALLVLLAAQLRGRLTLEYAERLGDIVSAGSAAETRAQVSKPGFWFRGGEARAVAILVRSQFRNDLRFRMAVLSILPMTLLYLFMGLKNSPSGAADRVSSGLGMVTIAVLLFPSVLKNSLGRSDSFRGSWIFFASPADRTRVIRSAKNVLVLFFLIPYLLVVGVVMSWFTHEWLYTAIYIAFAGLTGHLVLQMSVLIDPELPFAKPMNRTSSSRKILVTMILIGILSGFMPMLARVLYNNPAATALVLGSIVAASVLIDRLTGARIQRQAQQLEFEG